MWASRFWGDRFWARRYWAKAGATPPVGAGPVEEIGLGQKRTFAGSAILGGGGSL